MEDGKYQGWFIDWIEEWSQFIQNCNWYTFHVVQIEFENDKLLGGVEMTWVMLGLGFRIRWNHTVTEQVESIKLSMKDLV